MRLSAIAEKTTSTISEVPASGSRDPHKFDGTIAKIIDLTESIGRELDSLIETEKHIALTIEQIKDTDCQYVLSQRYLSFKTWPEIADSMNYGLDNVYRIHRKALSQVVVPKR